MARFVIRCVFGMWVVSSVLCARALAADEPVRPNIVLFLVDDLGWQDVQLPLGPAVTKFNRRYRTPNLMRLAKTGVRFTDAYAAAPVCTPTRTSLLTGLAPAHTRITYWTLHKDRDTSRKHPTLAAPKWRMNGVDAAAVTLPRLLQRAGYRTIHVGKAHFGAHGTKAADPRALGFDVNIAGHASGGPASFYGTDRFQKRPKPGKPRRKTVWDVPGLEAYHDKDVYLTEALATEASRALVDAVEAKKPFFLNFCPYAVHAPIMANERYLANYEGLDKREAAYATMIETVDAALGTLRETLERLGVWDDTLVVFASDNGGLSAHARGGRRHEHNAPLRSGKGSAYEGGIRTPLVIAGAGVTASDRVVSAPVVTYDLFPTLLRVAGVTERVKTHGTDLTPFLEATATDAAKGTEQNALAASLSKRALLFHQPHQWGANGPGIEPFTAVRRGRWKLLYFHADRRFELYDLEEDIGESWDRVASEPEVVRALARVMQVCIDTFDAQLSIDKKSARPIEGPAAACETAIAGTRELLERATACVPHVRQLTWQRTELAAFVHFGVNTFTDVEWGNGKEDPAVFQPTDFDADQWVRTFAEAGFKLVVLTAKHHDGFCLWPSPHTLHSVAASPWRDGKGDVVRDVVDACRKHGLRFGFYLSPADLHEMEPGGRYGNGSAMKRRVLPQVGAAQLAYEVDDYNAYFLAQLHELLTDYGPAAEVWFDGANPKPGSGQRYDYAAWYDLVRKLAPEAVIAIKGPDVRWVGNEAGRGRRSEWSVIAIPKSQGVAWPDRTAQDLGSRNRLRKAGRLHWHPAETDVSIRPGWFYHAAQDGRVKSVAKLLEIYDASVGNNCGLLLNVPPDRRGRIHDVDVGRLLAFGRVVRETFARDLAAGATAFATAERPGHEAACVVDGRTETYWTTPDWTEQAAVDLTLAKPCTFDTAVLGENIRTGQRIEGHALDVWWNGRWVTVARATTVGYRRILRFPLVTTDRVRLRIIGSRVRPTLSRFSLHRAPPVAPASK